MLPVPATHRANPVWGSADRRRSDTYWRSLQWFNLYRMVLVALVVLLPMLLQYRGMVQPGMLPIFHMMSATYVLLSVVAGWSIRRRWVGFDWMLTSLVVLDVLYLVALQYLSTALGVTIGALLIPYLAAAGLLSRGRMTLFHAAVASIALLLQQAYDMYQYDLSAQAMLQPAVLSLGCFASAWAAYRLARYSAETERLARQRGIDLANLATVNQLVIQDMPDGVLVVDGQGYIRQKNGQAEALLGPPRVRDVLQIDDYGPELGRLLRLWQDGATEMEGMSTLGSAGAKVRCRFVPVAASRKAGAVIFLEDVGREQAEAQHLKLAALGRLTANIAHEIRNPLSSISHAAELLAEDEGDDDARVRQRLTRIICENTERLDRMVTDILELNRRDRTQPEWIRLGAFLHTFVEEFALSERLSDQIFQVQVPEDCVLLFDRGHLHQILWNLVRNAARYATRQPHSVRLCAALDQDDGTVDLDVLDDGPGVQAAQLVRLFEPFSTTDSDGTGLGLYIAKELCASNQATLDYLPTERGACFRLSGRGDAWQG